MTRQTLFVAGLLCLLATSATFAQDDLQLAASPKVIDIDALYNGATINVNGVAPADSDVVLRLIGEPNDVHMKEKGKVFGVMWMNLDSLTFMGVPSVYIVNSATNLDGLAGKGDPGAGSAVQELGLAGIKDSAKIESKGMDKAVAFGEFLKLKQAEGLYREISGGIAYAAASDGMKSYRAEIPVPSRLSPGKYRLEAFAVRDGNVLGKAEQEVEADLVGFPALLSRLAFGHAALYGILASLIAIIAGFAVGLVFQAKGAH